jgi:muramoyltetrapeptide carboxypeptidase LdcA involved in peptidoglycan recycling
MSAFSDMSIDGIISSIGGDDSIRILPFLDLNIIREHPKIFMGYSDTCGTVRGEFGMTNLPLVTNMDFGHTDPMFVLPLGLRIRIDSSRRRVSIDEPAVI